MIADKNLFYDWLGANSYIFKAINGIHGEIYNQAVAMLSAIADYHLFPVYLMAMIVWTLANYCARKLLARGGAGHYLSMWFGIIMVFMAGFAVQGFAIKTMKTEFAYPRPYMVFAPGEIHAAGRGPVSDNDYHSFPSGHAAFITLVIAAVWPALSGTGAWIGLWLVVAVCWSRIALGMHFPADVVGGVTVALLTVMIVRSIVYKILRKLRIKC